MVIYFAVGFTAGLTGCTLVVTLANRRARHRRRHYIDTVMPLRTTDHRDDA